MKASIWPVVAVAVMGALDFRNGGKINDSANTWVTFGGIGDIPAGGR